MFKKRDKTQTSLKRTNEERYLDESVINKSDDEQQQIQTTKRVKTNDTLIKASTKEH